MENKKPIVNFDELQILMEKEPDIAIFAPKTMVDTAQKQIEKKLSRIQGSATELESQIKELRGMVKTVKNEDVSSYFNAVKKECDRELNNRLWYLETEYKNKAESIDAEIRKKKKELDTLEPTAKYYSAVVGSVLDEVKGRGYELSNESVTAIVCKALDVASYQKWQEIKGENWGRNDTIQNKRMKI